MRTEMKVKCMAVALLAAGWTSAQTNYVDFTAAQGYIDADVTTNADWVGNTGNIVSTGAAGYNGASGVLTYSTNTWRNGFYAYSSSMASPGDTMTLSSRFQYTTNGISGNKEVHSLLFADDPASSDNIRISFRRTSDGGVDLSFNNAVPTGNAPNMPESGAGFASSATSDWLELSATVQRGSSTNDWTVTITVTNLQTGAEVVSDDWNNVTPPAGLLDDPDWFAGINSGRPDNFSNVQVDTLEITSGYIAPPKNYPAIVYWGEPGGDLSIVSANQDFQVKATTYAGGTEASPVLGTSYYSNRTDRSTIFNHASNNSGNIKAVKESTSGDSIASGKNAENYVAMVVWEDFLTSDSVLQTLDVETKLFASAPTGTVDQAGDFRWLIEKGNGLWYASEPTTISRADGFVTIHVEEPANLTWYAFTPLSGGTASFGAATSLDMTDVTSVGYYTDYTNQVSEKIKGGVTNYVNKNINTETRFFKATASPGPVTSILLQWGAPGGDTNIVSGTANFQSEPDTYVDATEINPAVGAAYYPDSTNRSPLFNGALEFGNGASGSVRDDAGGDYIQTTDNETNHTGMIVWESFLQTPNSINGISGEFYVHLSTNSAKIRFVVKENGAWYAADALDGVPAAYTTLAIDPTTVNWNAFTPMSNGVAVVGAAVGMLPMTNVTAVGFYYDVDDGAAKWHGIRVRHFRVTGFADTGLSAYDQWAQNSGVTGTMTDDDDGDGLNNYGEYVFGGDPVPPNGHLDQGSQPAFDPTSGDYTYYLIGDNTVVAHVVSTDNLVLGPWTTNATLNVPVNDGAVGAYVEPVGTAGPQRFIKLLVE